MENADNPIAPDALEYGRKLFERECRFVAGANSLEMLPNPELTEIAFAGRSNVGKSTLINSLTRYNTLARTSRTPGRTQQINFFQLGTDLMLVDLPGYGYARASKEKIGNWTALIHAYLLGRPNLRRLCLLIDARHGLKKTDEELMAELDKAAVVYQIVLTKADKMSLSERESLIKKITALFPEHPAAYPTVLATSARNGDGIEDLRASLATLVAPDQFR